MGGATRRGAACWAALWAECLLTYGRRVVAPCVVAPHGTWYGNGAARASANATPTRRYGSQYTERNQRPPPSAEITQRDYTYDTRRRSPASTPTPPIARTRLSFSATPSTQAVKHASTQRRRASTISKIPSRYERTRGTRRHSLLPTGVASPDCETSDVNRCFCFFVPLRWLVQTSPLALKDGQATVPSREARGRR